mmetsp:Transcript_17085/g.25879  ORF Transcript_17085/g.25879 Transcript_17085/m.25879 type:complete len:427 (-) Transcript_17085:194-1474(-)|eukprot:CAMPEP_0178924680 /NCGR_PEP_ID=MMETSP0786-20121207/17462_1 /TAXON_ID=186022 /ORGANISM="Thalassionema frauenfeldii, Strain CCMP 1798" /LENGTH=426 /DNA_ID=CAMNT_0020599419 /DNA_START=39 /DNA_END=1319 /DNA_ORIENTATION=+
MVRRKIIAICFVYLQLFNIIITLLPAAGGQEEIDFPPILDSDDMSWFFEKGDLDGLHWALSKVFQRSARNPHSHQIVFESLPESIVSRGGGPTYTTAYKLQMDLEQVEYLSGLDSINEETRLLFRDRVIPIYKQVLSRIPPLEELERTAGLYAFRPQDYESGIAKVYNKALHLTDFDILSNDKGEKIPLLSGSFNSQEIEQAYFGETKESTPGVVVVDDVLSPLALQRIRQLLLESTVFYQTKMPEKFGTYAGAYIDDGLNDKILLQLAFELNQNLPRMMKGHALKYMWAYKYDSSDGGSGINLHADQAAVNVNLWLTPEDANLDKESGGLVVFTAKPPADWDFAAYNTDTERVVDELLKPSNFRNVTVPYRENRAVIFDSALFHHTDNYKFKQGYKNKRINLTLLYGNMQMGQKKSTDRNAKSEL